MKKRPLEDHTLLSRERILAAVEDLPGDLLRWRAINQVSVAD
ncbi:hypothetical protein ABIE56_000939 [Luteibacter sp. 621]